MTVTPAANPLDALAHHVATTAYEDLPAATVAAAKIFIFDTFACGIGGKSGFNADRVFEAAQDWGQSGDAHVWARKSPLPAPSAALANAYQIHCLEYDCVHEGAVLHPMSSLFAAAMAEVEREGRKGRKISGRELIAAVAVGVDVTCTIGLSSRAPMKFFRPAAIGGFGATSAVSRLRKFDETRTAAALGIMYGQTSGTMQPHVEGSPLLALQVGFAARSALVAADLAATGIDGPKNIITGQFGFLPLFEGAYDIDTTWKSWGREWRLLEVGHKPWPCGRLAHFGIEALQKLMAEHKFGAKDVKQVLGRMPPLPMRLVGRPDIPSPNPNYAKLCLAYLGAVTLLRGTVVPEDFADAALVDPITHALAAKFTFEDDGNSDPNTFGPQNFVVTLNSGARHELTITHALGDPRNPLPRDKQLEKFWWSWNAGAKGIPRAKGERLIELIDRLEDVSDATALIDCAMP